MGWKVKESKGDFESAPAGNHPAVLAAIIDLGVQRNDYQGVESFQKRAYFCWELVTEKAKNGQTFVVGIDLTVSLNEKAKLRHFIDAWRGKAMAEGEEFDISKLLGKKCLLTLTANKKGYPVVSGVAAIPKGMTVAEPTRKPVIWSLDDLDETGKIELPEWLPRIFGETVKEVIEHRCEEEAEAPTSADAKHTEAVDDIF